MRLTLLSILLVVLASGCAQNAQVGQAIHTETALVPDETAAPTAETSSAMVQGSGPLVTAAVAPPAARTVVDIQYDGSSAFSVRAVQGLLRTTLIDTVGPYHGQRALESADPVVFDVYAEGAWSLRMAPLLDTEMMPFSGTGDGVTPAFMPPAAGQWEIRYNGTSNFVIWLHCQNSKILVANAIGATSASARVNFGNGPCFWDVQSNGPWSLTPGETFTAVTPVAGTPGPGTPVAGTPEAALPDEGTPVVTDPASLTVTAVESAILLPGSTEAPTPDPATTAEPTTGSLATAEALPSETPTLAETVSELPAAEATVTPGAASPTPAVEPTAVLERVVVAHTDGEGVFLRASKRTSDRLSLYPEGTVLIVLGPPESGEGRLWLPVQAPDGTHGYVAEEFVAPYNP